MPAGLLVAALLPATARRPRPGALRALLAGDLVTLLHPTDDDVDADLALLAGRTARYVTDPHGWLVHRERYVTASRGRLHVEFELDGRIEDDQSYDEDEIPYGAPPSAAEARALAELYEQAEDILNAYRAGDYVPPPALTPYVDRQPRRFSVDGFAKDTWLESISSYVMNSKMSSFVAMISPYEPVTRQEQFRNIWRRMHGLEPLPLREKRPGGRLVWHYG